jgi:hypothetical protein
METMTGQPKDPSRIRALLGRLAVRRPRPSEGPESRIHAIVRIGWTTAAGALVLFALAVGVDRVTASPRLCGMCHEIAPQVETWRVSAHSQVGCPSCHEDQLPWYRFPETLAVRAAMLGRDLAALSSYTGDRTAKLSREETTTIPDRNCLHCHGPTREVTTLNETFIDHTEHAERIGSCIACHVWTTHREIGASAPLLLMAQCFTCHGRSPTAEVPGTCEVCHPETFELTPDTHEPTTWPSDHGEAALFDREQCVMCHEETRCRDCHGVEMPHAAEWSKGGSGHGPVAKRDLDVCRSCHGEDPGFCDMCHHKGFIVERGAWVEQHPTEVERRGAAFCFECHEPTFCSDCHVATRVKPETGGA